MLVGTRRAAERATPGRPPSASRRPAISRMRSRTKRPTPISTTEIRNGTRHPQARNALSSRTEVDRGEHHRSRAGARPAPPSGATSRGDPGCRPPECSTASSTAPPHSPPTPMPWRNRSTTSRTGAQLPISVVGGDHADQRGGGAHEQQRPHQHDLAPDAVAVVTEDRAPERPRDEADREGPVGAERAGERVERAGRRAC